MRRAPRSAPTPRSRRCRSCGRPRHGRRAGAGRGDRATRVLSNADPKRTFLGLVREGPSCRPTSSARIRAYRCEGASMKMNLAVAELPARSRHRRRGRVRPYHRGLVQLTKPLADLDADQASARPGSPPTAPTWSCASRACTIRRSRPRAGTSSRSGFARSPTGWRDEDMGRHQGAGGRPCDRPSRRVHAEPAGRDPASRGPLAARPGAPPLAHGRPSPARRHGARPAVVPAARCADRRTTARRCAGSTCAARARIPAAASPARTAGTAHARSCATRRQARRR